MQTLKRICNQKVVQVQNALYLMKQKLKEQRGDSHYVAILVAIVIAVVVGGILMKLFGTTIKDVWQKVADKINDLFNYA